MLKRVIAGLLLLVASSSLNAQILEPGELAAVTPSKTYKVGDVVELMFKATIDPSWYMYTVGFDADCGPILMEITLEKDASFELVGDVFAIKDKVKHDKIFECDVRIFETTGEFCQKIKILSPNLKIKGSYEGQVCSDAEGKCVPVGGDFTFGAIKVDGKAVIASPSPSPEKKNETDAPTVASATDTTKETPQETVAASSKAARIATEIKGPILDKSILTEAPAEAEESLWGYALLAFILGLTSLITPCVFPMIPMTVTFFLKDNQSKREGIRNAIIFGISIIVIYTIAGTIFALAFGAEGLNALATHWIPNLFIFIMFIVFALSFLGLFEINAPYKLINKADQAAEKGGLLGIFFMSATLVLVSFSCTIPIVGNVLVMAAGGKIIAPIVGMLAYSTAFAIPFTVFAIFPELMKSMPKSGGWLNTVKVTLGLLELALSLKFLSIVDQTYHLGILDREVNIAIWIVIFSLLGIYFLGKLRTSSDSIIEKVTVSRLMLAIATFTFVVYLVPGMWGAPLKALAGYLPPMHSHDFNLNAKNADNAICEEPKYSEFLHLPHGLNGYFDYKQALACAREQNKPLFIDFTGHGCVNCREMEAVVWSDPAVLQKLEKDFVVVALYVDDKTELPESEWYTSRYDNKIKKTIGKQNADLQIANLNNNAQPFYVLVGADERVLATPFGYKKDAAEFANFLEAGKKKYKELYGEE